MKAVTMQDLSGSPEELDSLMLAVHDRMQQLSCEINLNLQTPRAEAPLPCWFEFANAEIRYWSVVETWIKAAQGWSKPKSSSPTQSAEDRMQR